MKKITFWAAPKQRLFFWPMLFLIMCSAANAGAQTRPAAAKADTSKRLEIEAAEVIENFQRGDRTLQKLSGKVRLRQENTLVFCDTAILDENNAILKGSVVIEQGDSLRIFGDSAHYYGLTKQSDLWGDVVLVNGKQELYTDRMHYDLGQKVATYHNGATMSNGKSQLKSRHGYYYVNEKQVFFKGDVVVTDPDFTLRSDTMSYDTETQLVHFLAPTLISQRGSKIYTEGGFYDVENNFAEFDKNPQYEREGQLGRARKMRYDGLTKEYVLEGDATITEPNKDVRADVIRYNTDTEMAVLVGNAYYKDSTQEVTGAEIRYDSRNKTYQLSGRGKVVDKTNIIEADVLDFNDELGNGFAEGDVIWNDTVADYGIRARRLDYNKKTEFINAYGGFGGATRPMMVSLVDNDTLYLSADTLTSFKPDSATDARLLLAHRDVRIFKSDLQASCDSLTFNSVDSIFWFYKIDRQPLIWSDTSQFSGDTIRLALRGNKLDKLWLVQNSLVINSSDEQFFNQIQGKNTTAFFREDEVREMFVEGNARAIYYALDDKNAYVGVNESQSSEMRIYFGNNKVEGIKFYGEPAGKFIPMKQAKHTKVEGFFWEKGRRPRSVMDLKN
ncbi:MAG: hypothetical protein IT270_02800 [Saprospiraceae bacterium]|nr:hypothetical protein [Saprospiraceae bacterium]